MKRFLITLCCCLLTAPVLFAAKAVSPNGKLSLTVVDGQYIVSYQGKQVLTLSAKDMSGGEASDFKSPRLVRKLSTNYRMLQGKRLQCSNEANEYICQSRTSKDAQLVLRIYNDGLAFRYEYKNLKDQKPFEEQTVYRIPEGTKRWMQQWTDAYESFFPLDTTYQVKPIPAFSGVSKSDEGWNNRWGYPALLEPVDGVFALITEANIERRQSASCLFNNKEDYRVVPDKNELSLSGDWHSPWRVVIIGSLANVVESTLVTDVSEPSKLNDVNWIHPGVVSWIYWAYNHGSNDYNIIKEYVDMAVTLHLPYMLIDAEWDTMKDGYTIEDAVNYAKSKGIKPLIWYNSSVGWVDGAPTPKYRLNKPEDREKEFAWCEKIGVAGVKIDFFSGDNQMNMDYCIDLLESAAKHHLLVNFHGATIPRGWQRTYPNLLSTEAVYGAEWYNNVGTFTKKAAAHNATLPFTRNVIGPMDYTPCAFSDSQHPHITSNAHELALTVLYESALQHLADKPESYFAQPDEVQEFFGKLPTVWDETRFVGGYPADYVVLARRSGSTWYVAGINGTDEQKQIALPLEGIVKWQSFTTAFLDGEQSTGWNIRNGGTLPESVTCQPRGGFVFVIRE